MGEINAINVETLNLQNSTYTISYKFLTEDISYNVVVSNNGFTRVHSGTYSVVGYSLDSCSLRLVTPKYATYSFVNKLLLKTWTSSLDARINTSNELVVTMNWIFLSMAKCHTFFNVIESIAISIVNPLLILNTYLLT